MEPTSNMERLIVLAVFSLLLCPGFYATEEQLPCNPRWGESDSYVCVCNATYCDNVIREPPRDDEYVVYTSTASGQRLNKTKGKITKCDPFQNDCGSFDKVLVLNPEARYQRIEGFGGAATDSAGINWKSLPESLQKFLIDSYYDVKTGIGYNMVRVPIGGTDFSTHNYTLASTPRDDNQLSNFSLTEEDHVYKIPMLNAMQKASQNLVEVVASTWSPPDWMKKESEYNTCGHLKKDAYHAYANYHLKFIQEYNKRNIPIWAVTTGNEPIMGFLPIKKFNCLGFYPDEMGDWIQNHLGPVLRQQGVKLLGVDDQRFTLPIWFNWFEKTNPKVLDFMDGVAIHWYGDIITPPSVMEEVALKHPDKLIIYTEACEGSYPWEKQKVVLGSWKRAENYISNIIEDINTYVSGWIDWNICLDEKGGPTWVDNYVDSPIIVLAKRQEFVKQPTFYAMAHVAKFLPRGSRKIKLMEENSKKNQILQTAVVTPENTVVVVLANKSPESTTVGIRLGDRLMRLELEGRSFKTVEFKNYYDSTCEMVTVHHDIPGKPIDVNYNQSSVTVTYIPCL